jgi:uncharacterized membrane protein YwaF
MKKSNFTALVLGTISGVFFSLGMCMILLPEWKMRTQGVVSAVIGLALAAATVYIWMKMEGKSPIHVSKKTLGTVLLGVVGALLLGIGMSLCMVFSKMVLGIVIGLVGIVTLLMLIPLTKGLHD